MDATRVVDFEDPQEEFVEIPAADGSEDEADEDEDDEQAEDAADTVPAVE